MKFASDSPQFSYVELTLFMCPSSKLKQRQNIALRFFHTISLELKTQSGNTKYSEFLLC
ncbi:hypothetical protein MAL08_08595 [Leptospira noguchii]|uniref:hypothetical protein n=1 Tax=Leptospira noguchii TaxID=28182 RepID=UPI001FB68760|nr:hypothetical protein [Leptospira noguchii]UOG39300.1 hypothetical protein MAL08_08595 [Leptospira noguchii]